MNLYIVGYSIVKEGFFSDTTFNGIDFVEADSEKEAYDIEVKMVKILCGMTKIKIK